jgi:hypothetical protein
VISPEAQRTGGPGNHLWGVIVRDLSRAGAFLLFLSPDDSDMQLRTGNLRSRCGVMVWSSIQTPVVGTTPSRPGMCVSLYEIELKDSGFPSTSVSRTLPQVMDLSSELP